MNYEHLFTGLPSAADASLVADKMKAALYNHLIANYAIKIKQAIQDAVKTGSKYVVVDTEGLQNCTLDELAETLRYKGYQVIVRNNVEGYKQMLPGLKISWKPALEPAEKCQHVEV